jgi:energy-coupling factor transport system permease protein
VPTLGRDFTTTLDAQRARGYEVDKLQGGLFERIRRLAPLVVPVVITAILSGEEIIDAMDLRAFGTHKRTWIRKLQYRVLDFIYIGIGVTVLVGTFVLAWYGIGGDVWLTPFLPG